MLWRRIWGSGTESWLGRPLTTLSVVIAFPTAPAMRAHYAGEFAGAAVADLAKVDARLPIDDLPVIVEARVLMRVEGHG